MFDVVKPKKESNFLILMPSAEKKTEMVHHTSIENALIRFGHQMASIWFKHIFSCMTLSLASMFRFFRIYSLELRTWTGKGRAGGETAKSNERTNLVKYINYEWTDEMYADLFVAYQTLWSVPHWLFTDTKLFIQPECCCWSKSISILFATTVKAGLSPQNEGFHFFSGHRRRNKNWNGKPHLVEHEFIIIETHARISMAKIKWQECSFNINRKSGKI